MHKIPTCKRPKFLKGGLGQHMDPKKVSRKILLTGIKIEMEHTKSRCAAMWISLDHVAEHGEQYYVELPKMEKKLGHRR